MYEVFFQKATAPSPLLMQPALCSPAFSLDGLTSPWKLSQIFGLWRYKVEGRIMYGPMYDSKRNPFLGQEKEKYQCALLSILLSKIKLLAAFTMLTIHNDWSTLYICYLYETKFFCQSTYTVVSRLMCQL